MGGCCSSKDHIPREEESSSGQNCYPKNYHPVFDTELVGSYSTHGYRGRDPKQNQDTGVAVCNFAGNPEQLFFLVCDGHGSAGHKVSQFASQSIVNTLESDSRMKDMLAHPDHTKGGVVQALTEACEKSQEELIKQLTSHVANYSGTTCICTAINKNHVWTACVGDSRAVVGALKGNKVLALDLSADQCCSNKLEKERIRAAGGQIAEFGGFERVVAPDQNTVLAPTRSIGDCEFDRVGVIPTPEVTHFKLTGQEHVIILASDGLWEFVSSSQAVSIAMQCKNATDATDKLVQLSKRLWKQDGSGTYCDDITIIVIFLPLLANQMGSHAVAAERLASQEAASPSNQQASTEDIAIELESQGLPTTAATANETHQPNHDQSPDGRRRSLSELNADGSGSLGSDKSIIELAKRNIDNFQGLNPNARENIPNRSWSPEWEKKLWPK